MGTAITSCLYDCEVVHKRLHPKRHEFRYRLFFLDVDLSELATLQSRLGLFSHNRFNAYSLCDRDHLDLGETGIRGNLGAWMKEQGCILEEDDHVRLLTLPRIFGYIFNPVCFYLVSDSAKRPRCVVVEVCNTFREIKPWLIAAPGENGTFHLRAPKHFYVSPFTSLTTDFDFRVQVPGENLEIHIDDVEGDKTTLVSWIRGDRVPLTNARLAWYLLRYPFLTLLVIYRIHWQAFRLWLKKIPFFKKSEEPDLQRDLYHPHSSISDQTTEN